MLIVVNGSQQTQTLSLDYKLAEVVLDILQPEDESEVGVDLARLNLAPYEAIIYLLAD
ncbi:hypothetical protein AAOGI_44830 [Agarivorans albus]